MAAAGPDFLRSEIGDSRSARFGRLGGGSSALGDAVARPRDDCKKDLLRPALEEIIDLDHPLVRLAREIDWGFLDGRFASVCTPGPANLACRPGWWRGCSY